jgi:hypothetical protein
MHVWRNTPQRWCRGCPCQHKGYERVTNDQGAEYQAAAAQPALAVDAASRPEIAAILEANSG